MSKILLLHGPNLNLLGTREPEHYGSVTLDSINEDCSTMAAEQGVELEYLQSNAEHVLIDKIQQSTDVDFILINSAAFTHTSIAIRDALSAMSIPFIEIHLSNVYTRESFRHHSYLADIAVGVITGLGPIGYTLALRAALDHILTSRD